MSDMTSRETVGADAPKARPGYGAGREALLNAAIHVVANSGLRNLTYRAVAKEAGVTHGLVAHHFGSRDALLAEALSYAIDRSIESSSLRVTTAQVEDFVEGLTELVTSEPDLQAFQYELLLESRRRPELVPLTRKLYETYRAAAREGLRNLGIEDEALAHLVYATLDGLVMQQLTVGDDETTRHHVRKLREVLEAVKLSY